MFSPQKIKRLVLLLACLLFAQLAYTQTKEFKVSGRIVEKESQQPISGAVVMIASSDSLQLIAGAQSDSTGHYHIQLEEKDNLTLITLMSGYAPDTLVITFEKDHLLLDIQLDFSPTFLNEVTISETIARMEIRGDTVQFNAAAFQVNPDASAEDLIKKMPGLTIDRNTVKSNGDDIKKVIVDGKPFFGDDPSTTLKSLPADMIESVQVYDMQSDQATFGGYKDGNAEKTINIKTKKDRKNGNFGRVYGGYGTDDRYQSGFALNHFKDVQRVSLLGMTNNINQQNFSQQDLGEGGGRGNGGRGGRAQNMPTNSAGITKTLAAGINYNDNWGKKATFSGSYFFNETDNEKLTNTIRNYFSDDGQRYEENNPNSNTNQNHRGNFKLEYNVDTLNRITWNFRFVSQETGSWNATIGETSYWPHDSIAIQINNQNRTSNTAENIVTNLLYQHRFKKDRRTISFDLNTQWNQRRGSGDYEAITNYFLIQDSVAQIHQQYESIVRTLSINPTLSFTEPLGDSSMLVLNLKPSLQNNQTSRLTDDLVLDINDYALLSNQYEFQYNKAAANASYQYYTKRQELTIGLEAEQSVLEGLQTFPIEDTTDRTFFNILPRINYVRRFANKSNFNINLSSYTLAPTSSQLQGVLDISNPLFVSGGNPTLAQSRTNTIEIRFNKRIPESEIHYMVSANVTNTTDYIGNSTTILSRDTMLQGVEISRGAQISTFENLNAFNSGRIFGNVGFPLTKLKVNVNLTASWNYNKTPARMNSVLYYSENNVGSGSISVSSNISKDIDFTFAGSTTWNQVMNGFNNTGNNTFTTQTITAKINWVLKEVFVVSSDINMNYYLGLSQTNRQQYALWNAGLGYKMGKSKSFELKINAFDILKQNVSLNRTVNPTFTEDTRTQTLQRYGMLSLTYNLKSFKAKKNSNTE